MADWIIMINVFCSMGAEPSTAIEKACQQKHIACVERVVAHPESKKIEIDHLTAALFCNKKNGNTNF